MVSRSATLRANIVGDADQLERELKRAQAAVRDAERRMDDFGVSTGNAERQQGRLSRALGGAQRNWLLVAGVIGTATAATAGIVAATRGAVQAASDMEEAQSRNNVVFGESSRVVQNWVETQSLAFRLSQREATDAAGAMGTLFVSLGQTEEAAAGMSTRLLELTGDLSSFHNAATPEVLTALRSALVGEFEPMRRFGVALNAAAVEAKALELGLADTAAEITEADKVTARYNLILEGTAVAHGDAARTSDTLAAQQKRLRDQIDNLQVKIGTALLPVMTDVITATNDWIETHGDDFVRATTGAIEAMIPVLGNFVDAMKPAIEATFELAGGLARIASLDFDLTLDPASGVAFRSGIDRRLEQERLRRIDETRRVSGGVVPPSVVRPGDSTPRPPFVPRGDTGLSDAELVDRAFASTQPWMNRQDARVRAERLKAEEEAAKAAERFGRSLGGARTAVGALEEAAEIVNATFTDLDGKVRPLTEVMESLAEATRKAEEAEQERIKRLVQVNTSVAKNQMRAEELFGESGIGISIGTGGLGIGGAFESPEAAREAVILAAVRRGKQDLLPELIRQLNEQLADQVEGLPSFAGGGTVPGPLGSPQLIVAHGGESVGGGINVTVNVSEPLASDEQIASAVVRGIEIAKRTGRIR